MSSGSKTSAGAGSHHGSASSSPSSRNPFIQWFTSEIQQMMEREYKLVREPSVSVKYTKDTKAPFHEGSHGFGDGRRPLLDSAVLVEELVHQQMTALLHQAAGVALSRNARFIGIEDFLFLLRKDKMKLRRLLRYMMLKDKTAMFKSGVQEEEEGGEGGDNKPSQMAKKRTKICHDFLSTIDQTGELVTLFEDEGLDEVKHDRLLRAELQSRSMTSTQYLEFCEARQVTFCRKFKSHRFKDWLMTGLHLDIKPNLLALEVLSYLAYETVAQVVDLALLVKQDQLMCVEDPLVGSLPTVCINYQETSHTPATHSPPSTPTSSSANQGSFSSSQGGQSSAGSSHSSSKKSSKKRKKSGLSTVVEWSASNTILPADIREALRRYGHCFGPFSGLTKRDCSSSPRSKLLCC